MALTGFPNKIQVKLGAGFVGGGNGLDEDQVLVLTKVSGQNKWSENGTNTVNTSTNRILFTPVSDSSPSQQAFASMFLATSAAWQKAAVQSWFTTSMGTGGNYTFLGIFNGNLTWGAKGVFYTGWAGGNTSWTPPLSYKPGTFKTMEEYTEETSSSSSSSSNPSSSSSSSGVIQSSSSSSISSDSTASTESSLTSESTVSSLSTESSISSESSSSSSIFDYKLYSREQNITLPSDDTNLTTPFTRQDYIDVKTENDVYVSQTAIENNYSIFLFKNQDVDEISNKSTITWKGKTNKSCISSTVYLQVYNRDSTSWETLDSDNTTEANIKFTLNGEIIGLNNYKDINGWIAYRVYQNNG